MDSVKFVALLQSKSNRIGVLLVNAVLEWVLIALLLLNGLFSYLISKFAAFFGLVPPCVLCSRVDKLFEPTISGRDLYRRLLCHDHSAEISLLGYCNAHRRLADMGDLCEDCTASRPAGAAALSWMKRSEMGEDLTCSCCGVALESGFYSPFFLMKPSMQVLELNQKGLPESFEREAAESGELMDREASPEVDDCDKASPLLVQDPVSEEEKESKLTCEEPEFAGTNMQEPIVTAVKTQSASLQRSEESGLEQVKVQKRVLNVLSDETMDYDIGKNEENGGYVSTCCELCQVPNVDSTMSGTDLSFECSTTKEKRLNLTLEMAEVEENLSFLIRPWKEDGADTNISCCDSSAEMIVCTEELDDVKSELLVHIEELVEKKEGKVGNLDADALQEQITEEDKVEQFEMEQIVATEVEKDSTPVSAVESSFGDCFNRSIDNVQVELESETSLNTLQILDKILLEPADASCHSSDQADQLSPESEVACEERALETPSHVKELVDIADATALKGEKYGNETVDEGTANEIEGSEPLSVDHLRSALEATRGSLNKLYAELEHERSAAAIAADETLSMINRLQEEKASLQMEAMQYQRLMEQQSEYDQETLEMLNELVHRREKEKQDLQKELEECHQKIQLYEAKERRRRKLNVTDRNDSLASSSGEESDELSPSNKQEEAIHCYINETYQNRTAYTIEDENMEQLTAVRNSFVHFEEERFSILEQLKALEERLFTMEDAAVYGGQEESSGTQNGHSSATSNGLHSITEIITENTSREEKRDKEFKNLSYKGKSLLRLFDSVSTENGNCIHMDQVAPEADISEELVKEISGEHKRNSVIEEVNFLYKRLHALESDRDFLKKCVKSMKIGDKGLVLLHDISQLLRDLRNLELQARSSEMLSSLHEHVYIE